MPFLRGITWHREVLPDPEYDEIYIAGYHLCCRKADSGGKKNWDVFEMIGSDIVKPVFIRIVIIHQDNLKSKKCRIGRIGRI